MEDIQIENTKTIDELNQKLKETQKELREITKEKELVVQENNDLKLKLKELEKELDRHITNRWKSFVGEQVYTSHLPPSYN
jgi:regulator of replication initiation timing